MKRSKRLLAGGIARMSFADRLSTIECLQYFLSTSYVHLTLKQSLYGFDVLRALENLKQQAAVISDMDFHREMTTQINRLRDAHTQYKGPWAKSGAVASLPFLVEAYGPPEATTFIVSKADVTSITDQHFRDGVTVTHWNGIPFERALSMHADVETGGRLDSRRARALESMTFRALEYAPPPNEDWIDVTYVAPGEDFERTARFEWQEFEPDKAPHAASGLNANRFARSIHFGAELVRREKKRRFNHAKWLAEKPRRGRKKPKANIAGAFGDFFHTEVKQTDSGDFGYLRLWSFDLDDDAPFIRAVIAALKELPDRGLIIDIRNNPGGLIYAAERLLQLFTPKPVQPTKFALRATPLITKMARHPANEGELGEWLASLERAQNTGEDYSSHLPITPLASCNDLGQHYGGPVVVVADANTYSSGDLFAAGIVDNGIGPLICIGQATGAGGANVWGASDLMDVIRPLRASMPRLPRGVDFTLSIRRAVRGADSDGSLIEDAGISGQPYDITGSDVLNGNKDLINHCARILAAQKLTRLNVTPSLATVTCETKGLDRLDILVDGHPAMTSRTIGKDGKHVVGLKLKKGALLDVSGYQRGTLRQRRRIKV